MAAIDQKLIDRINVLAKKKKEGTITPEELKEQDKLRKEYIEAVHNNLRGILNNVQIQNPDGTIEDLKPKKKQG